MRKMFVVLVLRSPGSAAAITQGATVYDVGANVGFTRYWLVRGRARPARSTRLSPWSAT
jgi:hypothetical protein